MSDHPQIIRVHTAEGTVYARIMEEMDLLIPGAYLLVGPITPPAGLSQQQVVDHFRAQGWTVQQDNGTDFANPEWGE
jgi:hypothetical protein